MVTRLLRLIRLFPLTLLCNVAIWVLCLLPAETFQVKTFSFFDKVVHAVMYLVLCSLFWIEYGRSGVKLSRNRLLGVGLCLPVALSGLLEWCQEYLTATRYGDVYDFIANSTGVLLSYLLWVGYRRLSSRSR